MNAYLEELAFISTENENRNNQGITYQNAEHSECMQKE